MNLYYFGFGLCVCVVWVVLGSEPTELNRSEMLSWGLITLISFGYMIQLLFWLLSDVPLINRKLEMRSNDAKEKKSIHMQHGTNPNAFTIFFVSLFVYLTLLVVLWVDYGTAEEEKGLA